MIGKIVVAIIVIAAALLPIWMIYSYQKASRKMRKRFVARAQVWKDCSEMLGKIQKSPNLRLLNDQEKADLATFALVSYTTSDEDLKELYDFLESVHVRINCKDCKAEVEQPIPG